MTFRPTESELAILQVLWQLGACTVRQVHEVVSQHKDIGYTTTLKMMQLMHEKGMLKRTESQRSHVYAAAISEEDTRKHLLDRFLATTFGGSATKLVMQALGNSQTSAKELEEIKKIITSIEQKQKGGESC